MDEQDRQTKLNNGWRRWVLVLGLAFVGCLAIALVAPGFIDWTPYRHRFETVASDLLQRPVTISGPLSFRILPTPAFSAGSVTIDTLPEGHAPFLARIDRLDMELALFPLLRGDIEVRRFDLVRPLVNPERLSDGHVTWLLGGNSKTPAEARDIRFDNIVIRDGTLLVQDAVTHRNWRFESINARLHAGSLSGPFRLEGSARMDGLPLSLTLRTGKLEAGSRARLSCQFDVGEGTVAAKGWVRPLADTQTPDFSLAVEMNTPKPGLFLENAVRLTGVGEQVPPGFVHWLDGALSLKADLSGGAQAITLSDLKGYYDGSLLKAEGQVTFSDNPTATLALDIDRLTLPAFADTRQYPDKSLITADMFPTFSSFLLLPDGPDLDLTINVAAIAYGEGVASDVVLKGQIDDDRARLEVFEANLPGATRLSLAGETLDDGSVFKGNLRASSSSLRTLFDWLMIPHSVPEGRLSSLRLETGFEVGPDRLSATHIDMVLDSSRVTGSAALQKGSEKPAFEARLAVDRLDLDSYLPVRDPLLPPPAIEAVAESLNAGLGALDDMDLDLHLSVDRMRFMQHRLENLTAALSQRGKGLVIETLHIGSLDGLALTASGRVEKGERLPRFDLLLHGKTADLTAFAAATGMTLPTFMTAGDAALGELALGGKIAGDLSDLSLDLVGTILEGRMTAGGSLKSVLPDMSHGGHEGLVELVLTFDHASQRVLGQRLGMPWLAQGEALPLVLSLDLAGPLEDLTVRGDVTFLGGQLSLSGKTGGWLEDPVLSLELDVAHPSFVRLVQQVIPDYRPDNGDPGALKSRFTFDYDDSLLSIDQIALGLGKASVTGMVRVDFSDGRPDFDGTLTSHGPSLFAMLDPASPRARVDKADDGASPRWSHKPLDLSVLHESDGRLQLSMEDAAFDGVPMADIDAVVRLLDGVLFLDRMNGQIFDGSLELTGTLDATDTLDMTVDFGLTDIALGAVMDAGLGVRAVDGRAGIVGTLSARGRSPYDMVASLGGTLHLDAHDGTIKGFDLAALAKGVKEATHPSDMADLIGAFKTGDHSAFKRLSADIHVEKAVFTSENLKADLGAGALSGRFRADIADWALTAKGTLTLADHPKAPPVGIDMGGSLSRPVLALDTGPLGRWLLTRAVSNLPVRLPTPEKGAPNVPEVVGSDTGNSPKKMPPY